MEVVVTLKAYRDQAAISRPRAKPGFSINGQVGNNRQDAVVAVAEVLNQFRRGFTEGGVPDYAEAFSEALRLSVVSMTVSADECSWAVLALPTRRCPRRRRTAGARR